VIGAAFFICRNATPANAPMANRRIKITIIEAIFFCFTLFSKASYQDIIVENIHLAVSIQVGREGAGLTKVCDQEIVVEDIHLAVGVEIAGF